MGNNGYDIEFFKSNDGSKKRRKPWRDNYSVDSRLNIRKLTTKYIKDKGLDIKLIKE